MSEENKPVIKINLDKFTGDIGKVIEDKFIELEKKMTPGKEPTALTESIKGETVVEDFDWKVGIEEMLRTKRKDVGIYADQWDNPLDVKEITTTKFNEETRETEYTLKLTESLTEAIGTIGGGTIGATCCIPEIWADKIARDHVYPGSVFLGKWFIDWYDDIENKPGDKVYICRVGPALCTDMECIEPTTTAPTITCPYITLEHDVCAYAICKNDIDTVQYGLIDALNEGLGSCLEVCVDNYFFNVTLSCTNAGTLSSSGPMTGSLILEAMGSMLAGTYTPVKLIMHPVPWTSLMQDTNFTYANRFGARDVISGGRLEVAYGIELNVTPKGTLLVPDWEGSETASGTYRSLLLAKGAIAGAMKYGITVETEYSPRLQKRWVLADIKYGGVCLHPDGIYWIHSDETD